MSTNSHPNSVKSFSATLQSRRLKVSGLYVRSLNFGFMVYNVKFKIELIRLEVYHLLLHISFASKPVFFTTRQ